MAGTVAFGAAALASQGLWYAGYLSEAGVPGPGPDWTGQYRLGLLGVASGLILLTPGLWTALPGWLGRAVAGLVGCSGIFASISATVTCSPGCPLPPRQTPTTADLVHAAASILGVAACVLPMLLLAFAAADSALGRLSRRALWPVVPLVLLVIVAMVGFGRGHLAAVTEQALLLVVTAWAVMVAVVLATTPQLTPAPPRRS